MDQDPFKEYLIQAEPNKRDKGYAWHTAIGLQAVDGLKPSKYLLDTAIQNIEGQISIDEAQKLLDREVARNDSMTGEKRPADKSCRRLDRGVHQPIRSRRTGWQTKSGRW